MSTATIERQLPELLRKHFLFAVLEDAELGEVAAAAQWESRALGETIIEEETSGEDAYLVYSGRLRVIRHVDGRPLTLASLAAGDLFGEQALLGDGARTATVRTTDDCVLVRIPRSVIDRLLAVRPALGEQLRRLVDERSLNRFLRMATFLGKVPAAQMRTLIDALKPCKFAAGAVLMREGEPGDEMFIIRNGEVRVSRLVDGAEQLLRHCSDGEHLGEIALIKNQPRSATVVAVRDTQCYKLERRDFDALLSAAPDVKEQLTKKIEQYLVDEELEKKFGRAPGLAARRNPGELVETAARPTADGQAATEEPAKNSKRKPRRNWLGFRKKYPWVRQHEETDCGAASLAMVAQYHGTRLSVGRVREMANVGREGASLLSLARAAEKLGFTPRAVKADYDRLCGVDLPCIAHWQGYHYVVVYEATASRVVVGDPAVGVQKMSVEDFKKGWGGLLLLLHSDGNLQTVESSKTTFRQFLPFVLPYKKLLLEVVLLSLVLELLQMASPMLTQTIIDKVLVHQNASLLNIILAAMVIIGVFQLLGGLLRQYLLIYVSQRISLRLSSELFTKMMRLPLRFFHTRRIGDLIQRFQDNAQVQEMLTGTVISTALDLLTGTTVLALMLYYNAKLTLLSVGTTSLFFVITFIFTPFLKRNNQRLFEQSAKEESSLIESLKNVDTVKQCSAENQFRWKHENVLVGLARLQLRQAKLGMGLDTCSQGLTIFTSTFMMWYGATLVMSGELTLGQLMAFQSLIGQVTGPLTNLIGLWDELHETGLALERLGTVYDGDPEQSRTRAAVPMARLRGSVKFENVSFRYNQDDKDILSGINLDVTAGKTIALVGRSGSGKTTLITLLQGFYHPTDGRILIDGVDLKTADLQSFRRQVGVVSQQPTLFTGTIRENIALSDPEASLEQVIWAAKIANAHDFVMNFPLGYETKIGEIGVQLSGGQRQRICIARALLCDPRIIIFDEATSALDTESERMIQQNMQYILKDRTAFVIAHRLSTVQNADKILVLEQGAVIESGTHRELLDRKGLYFYLNGQQLTM